MNPPDPILVGDELEVQQTVPVLRMFDRAKADEFYIGYLGFKLDWEHRFDPTAPVYMQISRGACVLHLTEHHGDCCPGSTVLIRIAGIESFHQRLDRNYPYMRPGLEQMPWNARMVTVMDPFGNRLRFTEDNP